jgi:DNA-binding beta-propeller fold protein YncE
MPGPKERKNAMKLLLLAICCSILSQASAHARQHEVWLFDQSGTRADGGGGTLYIYDGAQLQGSNADAATPEVIDLGRTAHDLAVAQTGTVPVRPHMFFFNRSETYGVLAYVATGHVLFIEAKTRKPTAFVDVGEQAHAAYPAANEKYVIVANQNGKKVHRIWTDYEQGIFLHDTEATLDLATGVTPNGLPKQDPVLRPDNAPICLNLDSSSRYAFVTLRGGGLFVVDVTKTPMSIVAEYDASVIHPNGCIGLEAAGKLYVNSGGGSASNPYESDLYSFPLADFSPIPAPPNTPVRKLVFSRDALGVADSHGGVLTRDSRYLWVADRAANLMTVVDTHTDLVVNEFSLISHHSFDPTPDLMGISPDGNRAYVTLRGPNPLTGNFAGVNNAVGITPGLGIIRITEAGRNGVLQAIAPVSHKVDGVERADPHGIGVRSK